MMILKKNIMIIVVIIIIYLIISGSILGINNSKQQDNIPIIPAINCVEKIEEIKKYYEDNNPDIKIEEVIQVYQNNDHTCSIMAAYKKNNEYRIFSGIANYIPENILQSLYRIFSGEANRIPENGRYVLPYYSHKNLDELRGSFGKSIRRVIVSLWATDHTKVGINIYLVNNLTKTSTLLGPIKFEASGIENQKYLTFDIPENHSLVFVTEQATGHKPVLSVVDYIEIPIINGGNLSKRSLKNRLFRVATSDLFDTTSKHSPGSDDNRIAAVKRGELNWSATYRTDA
jgi:hypothetical protein